MASEQWEVASFPFAPHINERPAGAALHSRPLHERLDDEVAYHGHTCHGHTYHGYTYGYTYHGHTYHGYTYHGYT